MDDSLDHIKNQTVVYIKELIEQQGYDNWLDDFPWLTGSLGNPFSPVWFIGENPSLGRVKSIDLKSKEKAENLQWLESPGDKLLRIALTEAKFKSGDPYKNEGWNCFLTNAVKRPDKVGKRNSQKQAGTYADEARVWGKVLRYQIDAADPYPNVLVAMGKAAHEILCCMQKQNFLPTWIDLPVVKIHHYSYIMSRPESGGQRRGPRDPGRMSEYKERIKKLSKKHLCD